MNNDRRSMNLNSRDAVVLNRADVRYGAARPLDVAGPYPVPDLSLDLLGRLKFMFAEVTGIWFVLLTSMVILAVPVTLLGAGRVFDMIYRTIKRTIDIVGALVGLVLALPIMIILPILIKLDSPGPVFYTQTRVGLNRRKKDRRFCQKTGIETESRARERRRVDHHGRLFKVIKFRTMVADAERHSGPVWATKNDDRITGLGAFMRKTRLDEIPQFFNVLAGDMSLVGPRPERPHFVSELRDKVPGYTDRLQVKPGLTGLAQVESGYDSSVASVARKVDLDRQYINRMSIWTDVSILLRTVVVVLTGRGAC